MKKKIILASDHAGFELKDELRKYAEEKGYEIEDLGPKNDEKPVSYAEQGLKLSNKVVSEGAIGIGICGTGLGISYAVNRVKHARGARVTSIEDAHLSRQHNDANVIIFGGRQVKPSDAKKMLDEFLNTEFEGGRHQSRIDALDK
ncbi:MAG: RpiB/LacA/LacB family sugar-phosphate isomerase [Mycoplasmatales bacterium]|nr:RpiB/LacA/LacB family sugar-phosphate isomerase [Mycoplasmatales bacterium]